MTKLKWNIVKPVELGTVKVGTVFECNNQVYLKVTESQTVYNVFSFEDNCLVMFDDTETVEVLESELYLTRQSVEK